MIGLVSLIEEAQESSLSVSQLTYKGKAIWGQSGHLQASKRVLPTAGPGSGTSSLQNHEKTYPVYGVL